MQLGQSERNAYTSNHSQTREDRVFAQKLAEVIRQMDARVLNVPFKSPSATEYHPKMLLAIMFYGHINCLFSSRLLEQATHNDPVFQFLATGFHPHHDSLRAFRRKYTRELEVAYAQILLYFESRGENKLGSVRLQSGQAIPEARALLEQAEHADRMDLLSRSRQSRITKVTRAQGVTPTMPANGSAAQVSTVSVSPVSSESNGPVHDWQDAATDASDRQPAEAVSENNLQDEALAKAAEPLSPVIDPLPEALADRPSDIDELVPGNKSEQLVVDDWPVDESVYMQNDSAEHSAGPALDNSVTPLAEILYADYDASSAKDKPKQRITYDPLAQGAPQRKPTATDMQSAKSNITRQRRRMERRVALLVVLAMAAAVLYTYMARWDMEPEVERAVRAWVAEEYAGHDLMQKKPSYFDPTKENVSEEAVEETLHENRLEVVSVEARGGGDRVAVKVKVRQAGKTPEDGKGGERYYFMRKHPKVGWRMEKEITALSYYLKI